MVWAANVDEPVKVEVDLLEETACDVIATELELSEDSRVEPAENVEETVVVALDGEANEPSVDSVVVGGIVKLFLELLDVCKVRAEGIKVVEGVDKTVDGLEFCKILFDETDQLGDEMDDIPLVELVVVSDIATESYDRVELFVRINVASCKPVEV